jgi:hypothetical protein
MLFRAASEHAFQGNLQSRPMVFVRCCARLACASLQCCEWSIRIRFTVTMFECEGDVRDEWVLGVASAAVGITLGRLRGCILLF